MSHLVCELRISKVSMTTWEEDRQPRHNPIKLSTTINIDKLVRFEHIYVFFLYS